ncbi:MAG: hypothetical protein AB7F19_05715 [Candidatus Babeliales bacterium]
MIEFLSSFKNPELQPGVVCFSHKTYPALFFAHMHRAMRIVHTMQSLDAATISFAEIQTQCNMSFLGAQHIIWLGNVSDLDAKKQQQIVQFCSTYTGPHALWFFYNGESTAIRERVQLPQTMSFSEYQSFCILWYPQLARSAHTLKDLFKDDAIDLEFAAMLMQYHLVVGKHADLFIDQWAGKLSQSEQSLFTLTTYFFSKQTTPFFRLWKTIEPEYPAVFWASFWSEQLFRAACVIEAMKANNHQLAKKMAYRLPFSFMQKDYKRITIAELQYAHQFMYDYDVHIKNNGSVEFIDIMFSAFFVGSRIA